MMTKKSTYEIDSVLSHYKESAIVLLQRKNVEHFLGFYKNIEFFWSQWIKLHQKILGKMLLEIVTSETPDQTDDSERVNDFLKTRERLLSVLIQKLKEKKIFDGTRQIIASLMRQHDENFRNILQSAQNEMRRELKKAFAASKAVKGYAKTSSFGG